MTSRTVQITRLGPADYERVPWKNGGGETVNIATAFRAGTTHRDWRGVVWRFGRTAIVAPGPFSDFSGFDRAQVVVAGRGLVLETARGEIDLREPFRPALYPGEPPIVSRLEAGPVEVVNLIGDRSRVAVSLASVRSGAMLELSAGEHIVYAASGPTSLRIDAAAETLAHHHALRLSVAGTVTVRAESGIALIGSVVRT